MTTDPRDPHSPETNDLSESPDAIAPDGSEIRLLSTSLSRGSLVHCRLPPGAVTRAVRHTTVEEMWACIAGDGRLWRSDRDGETVTDLRLGVGAALPVGTVFQFRNDGEGPLEIVIATMPPWPGEDEAILVDGPWEATI